MKVTTALLTVGNSPVITILCLAGFLSLGCVSNPYPDDPVAKLVESYDSSKTKPYARKLNRWDLEKKQQKGYTEAQAEAVKGLWHLTDADIDKKVDLFLEGEKL